MLNRVVLIGRLTRDPEMRYTSTTGVGVANFTLAVDRAFQSSRGEKETDFIRIVCWDKLAETCNKHLTKGRLVAVEGRLEIRNWETKTGERRQTAEIRADSVQFLDKPSSAPRSGGRDADGPDYDDQAPEPRAPRGGGEARPQAPARPQSPRPQAGKKNYGEITDAEIDEEIDLDDDPF